MKILLSDQVIETPIEIEQGVQVVRYDGQTFDELLGIIVGLATEPFYLAIVVNNNLANIIPFFDETIVVSFKALVGLKSVSFYGDNFTFTNKYIEFFNLLQQELEIDVYYTGRRGVLRGIRRDILARRLLDLPPALPAIPEYFVGPFATPALPAAGGATNEGLFNNCNQGCWKDKEYFTKAVPNTSHKLSGDLTIDYTGHYTNPILISNRAIFDGCGYTITLDSDIPLSDEDGFGVFEGLFNLQNGSIVNTTIKVNTKYVTLAYNPDDDKGSGWLCKYDSASSNTNAIECLIDNCHVCANLTGPFQGGLVGSYSFRENAEGSKFVIQNCSFTGDINNYGCSGIVSYNCFYSNESATITVQNCSSTGDINSNNCCGIMGSGCFNSNKFATITVQNCSSTGDINGFACGGVAGAKCFTDNSGATITVNNCSSTGDINYLECAGVLGTYSVQNNSDATITINSCSSTGDINCAGCAGVLGAKSVRNNSDATITVNSCSSTGDINDDICGGVAGVNCFSSNSGATITVQNCCSFCNIAVNARECGGVLGPNCGVDTTPQITVKECNSTGTVLNSTSYAILGPFTQNCNVSNCIYNSFYNTKAGSDYIGPNTPLTALNNSYTNTIGLSNITGRIICNDPNTAQIIYTPYGCPLHPKLLNTCPYQKQNKNLTIVAAFSICKPISICSILTFILKNVCSHEHLFIYSKDMKFKSPLYWNGNNAQYNGTLASGTYIIAAKKHC